MAVSVGKAITSAASTAWGLVTGKPTTVSGYGITDAPTLTGSQVLTNKTLGNTNTVTLKDTGFTLQDDGDTTKQAVFQLSGLTTGTTYTYNLPAVSGSALATLGNISQTFAGSMTVNGALTAFGNITLGGSVSTATISLGAGATSSGITKTVSIGTAGASGSTTTISIGPSSGAGAGTMAINGGLTLVTFNQPVKMLATTVAGLPSAATAGNGARAHVTDALAPTFGATVAGSGAVSTPVYSDGTNWKVG